MQKPGWNQCWFMVKSFYAKMLCNGKLKFSLPRQLQAESMLLYLCILSHHLVVHLHQGMCKYTLGNGHLSEEQVDTEIHSLHSSCSLHHTSFFL